MCSYEKMYVTYESLAIGRMGIFWTNVTRTKWCNDAKVAWQNHLMPRKFIFVPLLGA